MWYAEYVAWVKILELEAFLFLFLVWPVTFEKALDAGR